MSKTLYVNFRGNGFWTYDVPSSVYLKFLIDAAVQFSKHSPQVWLTDAIHHWRVNALMSDFGLHLDDNWTESEVKTVIKLCATASQSVRNHGNISSLDVSDWDILNGKSIRPVRLELGCSIKSQGKLGFGEPFFYAIVQHNACQCT